MYDPTRKYTDAEMEAIIAQGLHQGMLFMRGLRLLCMFAYFIWLEAQGQGQLPTQPRCPKCGKLVDGWRTPHQVELHRSLDEMLADFLTNNRRASLTNTTLMEFLVWCSNEAKVLTHEAGGAERSAGSELMTPRN